MPDGRDGGGRDGDGQARSELAEAVEFTAKVAGEAAGRPVPVYPMSARAARTGRGDPGFAAFAGDFAGYLETGRASDLRMPVAGHACHLARSLRDEAGLARRAAQMLSSEAGAWKRSAPGWPRVATRRQDAADLAAAESARMLADLNETEGQAAGEVTARVAAEMDALVNGGLRSARAAEIERAGRARRVNLPFRRPKPGVPT